MKAGAGKRKGGNFENKMCKELSLWFSGGERDDLFTRTASSGGRFTIRKRNDLHTANQEGDITATTEEGLILIRNCAFEMKTGYKNWSIMDIIDKPLRKGKATIQTFESFYEQVAETEKFPIIIAKKDGRQTMIFFTHEFHEFLSECENKENPEVPECLAYYPDDTSRINTIILCVNLEKFFAWIDPGKLKENLKYLETGEPECF